MVEGAACQAPQGLPFVGGGRGTTSRSRAKQPPVAAATQQQDAAAAAYQPSSTDPHGLLSSGVAPAGRYDPPPSPRFPTLPPTEAGPRRPRATSSGAGGRREACGPQLAAGGRPGLLTPVDGSCRRLGRPREAGGGASAACRGQGGAGLKPQATEAASRQEAGDAGEDAGGGPSAACCGRGGAIDDPELPAGSKQEAGRQDKRGEGGVGAEGRPPPPRQGCNNQGADWDGNDVLQQPGGRLDVKHYMTEAREGRGRTTGTFIQQRRMLVCCWGRGEGAWRVYIQHWEQATPSADFVLG